MRVSAVKGIRLAAIAMAVVMTITAASADFNRHASLGLFLGSCVLIVVTLLWYRRAIADAEAQEEERQAQQLLTLKQQLSTGEPLAVKASSGLVILLVGGTLLVFYGHQAFTSPGMGSMVGFVTTALVTLFLAIIIVPRVGKAALTIRPDGLEMPVYGFLRWDEIESIGLRRYQTKGVTTHSIDIYVPDLRDRERRMHPLLRLAPAVLSRSSPNFIMLHLMGPSLPARLVHALCYDLWKARTGKARSWTSSYSEQQIEESRRAEERREMTKRVEAQFDPAKVIELLAEFDKEFGPPSVARRAQKPLTAGESARLDALLAEMRATGARDPATASRLIDKHVQRHVRDMGIKLVIAGIALAAMVVAAFALFAE